MREEVVKTPKPQAEPKATPHATSQTTQTRHDKKRQTPKYALHAVKCRICNHPDRHSIEFDFLNWRNPADLARSYQLRDITTIYRHAHATGLFARRRLNLRFALERIVERVAEVPVTASSVIRAARAITRINDSGEWVDPPTHLIVTHEHPADVGSASSTSARQANQGDVPGTAGRDASAVNQGRRDKTRSHKAVRLPLDTRHSSLATVFNDAMLDEPLPSASAAGEMPKIPGAPTEIILELSPGFRQVREERARAIEADRQAIAEKQMVDVPSSSLPEAAVLNSAPSAHGLGKGTASVVPTPSPQEKQSVASSPSLLPQAASPNSAPSAHGLGKGTASVVPTPSPQEKQPVASSPSLLPQAASPNSAPSAHGLGKGTASAVPTPSPQEKQPVASSPSSLPEAAAPNSASHALTPSPSRGPIAARLEQTVASPSSTLPAAASNQPATAKQSPRPVGPQLGSSASADPPFPFIPRVPLKWKARRHFLIANETHSRGESND